MRKVKHTPLPWKLGHRDNFIIGPNGAGVADCVYTHSRAFRVKKLPSGDECVANAELIIHAVNFHDNLVRLISKLAAALRLGPSCPAMLAHQLIELVEAATAKDPTPC